MYYYSASTHASSSLSSGASSSCGGGLRGGGGCCSGSCGLLCLGGLLGGGASSGLGLGNPVISELGNGSTVDLDDLGGSIAGLLSIGLVNHLVDAEGSLTSVLSKVRQVAVGGVDGSTSSGNDVPAEDVIVVGGIGSKKVLIGNGLVVREGESTNSADGSDEVGMGNVGEDELSVSESKVAGGLVKVALLTLDLLRKLSNHRGNVIETIFSLDSSKSKSVLELSLNVNVSGTIFLNLDGNESSKLSVQARLEVVFVQGVVVVNPDVGRVRSALLRPPILPVECRNEVASLDVHSISLSNGVIGDVVNEEGGRSGSNKDSDNSD